jgi:uncharacterized repeat protein (TIGR03803 family)
MKTRPKKLLLQFVLIIGLGLMMAGSGTAQTFTTLRSFGFTDDGLQLEGGFILSGNTLYGTTGAGGQTGNGTVFKVNTDGTGFTNLYNFSATLYPSYINSDGASPYGTLILSGNILYGTAAYGGPNGYGTTGYGTVFAVHTDGTGFTTLHSFTFGTNSDGANPFAGLVLAGNTLYGTTCNGGSANCGIVFKVNTDGSGFTNLHNFTEISGYPFLTNSDGACPKAGLILSGYTLYGTTSLGGTNGDGTVFALNTDGTGFTNLHNFTAFDPSPSAALLLSGNTLYGTTLKTVFALNADGTGFTNLYSIAAGDYDYDVYPFIYTNSDGSDSHAGLALSGNTLYGTASLGGSSGYGTVFAVHTDGEGFTNLHNFTGRGSDGAYPESELTLLGNTLYGTTKQGGSLDAGTVFSISIPAPQNQPPVVANPIPDQTNTYGNAFNYTFPANTFSDPDFGQTLAYNASNLPPGIIFDGSSRTFSGTNTDVGSYDVTVTATDDGSPPLSANDVFNVTVGKAVLNATAFNQTNSYGANVYLDPHYHIAYSGFKFPGDYVFSLQTLPNIQTTAIATSPVGVYPITLNGGNDPHYSFVLQSGQLTLTNAPLTVIIFDAVRAVGRTNPPFSGKIIGLQNNDPIMLAFSTTATLASPLGDYLISVTFIDPNHRLTNYAVSTVQGELTIIPYDFVYGTVHSFWTTNEMGVVDVAYHPGASVTEGFDGVLYGVASSTTDDPNAFGAIFRVNKNGTGYQALAHLAAQSDHSSTLVQGSNGMLYGTAPGGGSFTPGNIFTVSTNGTGSGLMHTFDDSEGTTPNGPLLLSTNGAFYGSSGNGAESIYRIQQDGTGFTVLWQSCCYPSPVTNEPSGIAGGLIEGRDGALYGTSGGGGQFGPTGLGGTVFKLQKDGSGMTILHSFEYGGSASSLIEDADGVLYGTTPFDAFGNGTVFRLNEDGSGFAVLHQFSQLGGDGPSLASLLLGKDGLLYGTTRDGGNGGPYTFGTVFRLKKDGTGYCVLHNSGDGPINSGYLTSALIQGTDGIFYGTAQGGGALNVGAVFRLFELVPPTLNINPAGPGNMTLSWQPPTPGFVLQQSDSLMLAWTNTLGGTSSPISLPKDSPSRFYRLHSP